MAGRWLVRKSGHWFILGASILCACAYSFGVSADEARRCSPWRSGGKGYEQLELRTCARPEGEAKAPAREGDDDANVTYDIEAKSGYDKPVDVRIDVTTTDGTVEGVDVELKSGLQVAAVCSVCRDHGDVKSFRVGKTQSGKDEPLRQVKGTMHMEILARDLRLTDTNAQRLERIAARYHKATRNRLVVTGGSRTPARQAQLMYDKLVHGDDIVGVYENKAAAVEVRNAYRDAVAKRLKRKATIRAVRDVIEAQMARGVYVSKHLRSGAVDVRSWNMKGKLEQALRDAVKAEAGVTMMDERDGAEPHFHLNLL